MTKIPDYSPASPAASPAVTTVVPESLQAYYLRCGDAERRLIKRMTSIILRDVAGLKPDYISVYWAVNLVLLRSGIPRTHFVVLSYLYQVTIKGRNVVNTGDIYRNFPLPKYKIEGKRAIITRLKNAGYISRSTSDPSRPYLSRSHRRQPVFIKLTGKGIKFCNDVNREVNNILMRQSLADLTGEQ